MMLRKFKNLVLSLLWVILCWRRHWLFWLSASDVASTQKRLLLNILRENKNTEFGKKFSFFSIKGISDFQSAVPLSAYEDYCGYIRSISKGEKNILTREPILTLGLTSGSSAASKLIPFTAGLKGQFQNAVLPWMFNLYTKKKNILFGRAYWSITPIIHRQNRSLSTVPLGFEEDTEYFGFFQKKILKKLLVVPREVCAIQDVDNFTYVTLLFLLEAKDLSFVSVWNPTYLTCLLKRMDTWLPLLIHDIRDGTIHVPTCADRQLLERISLRLSPNKKRAGELEALLLRFQHKRLIGSLYENIWPNLSVISCWADGNSAHYLQDLRTYFPKTEIQGKGLLATEGTVSFPLVGQEGKVLAIRSHFFEFLDTVQQNHTVKLAHELEIGKRYSVVITTAGGLYRYRLEDVIEVIGLRGACPLVTFIGRASKVSDLYGEKLNEYHMSAVLESLFREYNIAPYFFMVAPEKEKDTGEYCYVLFMELNPDTDTKNRREILWLMGEEFEQGLKENFHYRYCRLIGQLTKSKVFLIEGSGAAEIYIQSCTSFGQRQGDIKHTVLDGRTGWSKRFSGKFLEEINAFTASVGRDRI